MGALVDITGKRFGLLTVIERVESRRNRAMWRSVCDCGNERIGASKELINGTAKSCGCLRMTGIKKAAEMNRVHGRSETSTFKTWESMKRRCLNSTCKEYPLYGGRGIGICEKWMEFSAFYADMGDRPLGKTLDRIDVNGGYSPSNCRWASAKEQARNRRNNRVICFHGESKTLSEWAEWLGCGITTLRQRLEKGWSEEMALSTPVRAKKKRGVTITPSRLKSKQGSLFA